MGLGIISLAVALVLAIALGFGVMLHFGVDNNGSNFAPGMCLYKHFSTKPKPDKITFKNQTAKGIRPIHRAGRKSTSVNENQDPIPTSNRFSPLQTDVLESEFEFQNSLFWKVMQTYVCYLTTLDESVKSCKMCGNKFPVLCNKENFLLRSNCYKIRQCLPDFHVISKSAIKLNLSYGWPINRIILEMLEHVCVSWMIFFSSSNLPRFTQANCFLKKHMELSIYRI